MAAPIRVGLFYDFPQRDGGDSFEVAVHRGWDDASAGRIDRGVEFVRRLADGLPSGTAHSIETEFASLADEGVLAIVGPSISDNGIIVRDLCASREVACINYTGGAITRGDWMFHYQVGSLEEEPAVLAQHVAERGLRRVSVVHDRSPVGQHYADWFERARVPVRVDVAASAAIPPLSDESGAAPIVERVLASDPDAVVYLGLGAAARGVSLALAGAGCGLPVVANSALMFGYAQKDWRAGWEGWVYVDTVSDDNPVRRALKARDRATAAGPVGVAGYDIGRLLAEAVVRTDHLTREGIREGLERVKRVPAASGHDGTMMGFGQWDHAALKGPYLVLRTWQDGRTVQVEPTPHAGGVVERYLAAMTAHDWDALTATLDVDVVRNGPYRDVYRGREAYVAFLSELMPSLPGYSMEVARVTYSGSDVFVELSETVSIDGEPVRTEESLVFHIDNAGTIDTIDIFIKTASPR
jgi:ABC-type branched-subunit amino acid transport system substrate-binding protein/limonene-1,2-epoxide hydrolase